jgi:hypothetical protein
MGDAKKDDELFSEENMAPWKRFTGEMNKGRAYPINEFEHAAYLVDSEKEAITEFSQIVDRSIQLANIDDDRLLRLEQTSAGLMVNFFDMARREPALAKFFEIRYNEWRAELLLTKTKSGSEREKQAAVGTKYVQQSRQISGYNLPDAPPENEDKDIWKRIFPKKR